MIEHIAVVGAGYMGGGIAQVFALAGMDVVIVDADPNLTARHLDRLRHEAQDFESRGLFDPGSAELVRKNLRAADTFSCPASSSTPVFSIQLQDKLCSAGLSSFGPLNMKAAALTVPSGSISRPFTWRAT